MYPWKSDIDVTIIPKLPFLLQTAWMPEICGSLIGLLQLPLYFTCGSTIGSSSQYITLIAQIYDKDMYFSTMKNGWNNFWQVYFIILKFFFIMGGGLGGYIYHKITPSVFNISTNVDNIGAFLGGFLLLFGSRMARGCPRYIIKYIIVEMDYQV